MCQPKDIVSSLRDRVLKESDADVGFPKSADADNSRVLRAKLLATSDNISFSSRLGVFVIADQESVYTVKLFPTELCTCPLKKNCVHILGVKLGQRMEIHEDELAIQKTSRLSGWMNDTIIDSAMNLLQFQFPDLEGFQSCTLAVQLDFQRHEKLFIQIINRSPNTKGTHWLTVSNINCMEDEVGVYDTAFDDLPHIEQLVVASLVKTEQKVLKVKFSNVYMQTNGNDCGLYAIANATALAFGRDPSKEQYIPSKLREHLLKCLEEKEMRLFPTAKGTSKRRKAIKKIEKN